MADFELDQREQDTILLAFEMLIMDLETEPQEVQRVVIVACLFALEQLSIPSRITSPVSRSQSLRSRRNRAAHAQA